MFLTPLEDFLQIKHKNLPWSARPPFSWVQCGCPELEPALADPPHRDATQASATLCTCPRVLPPRTSCFHTDTFSLSFVPHHVDLCDKKLLSGGGSGAAGGEGGMLWGAVEGSLLIVMSSDLGMESDRKP